MSTDDPRRAIVDLLPQFLIRRRRGFAELQPLLDTAGLERPLFFLLMALAQESDPGNSLSEEDLRARLFNPYSTVFPFLAQLPALSATAYLGQADGRYTVTPAGRSLIDGIERAAQRYLTRLTPLPSADLTRLTHTLVPIADRLWLAPEPGDKPHQARLQRLPAPPADALMPQLERAIFSMWMARDDAHNAAWRAAGFDGPTFDLLTRLWTGEAGTEAQLTGAVEHTQRPDDVAHGVEQLITVGHVARDDERLVLTAQGRAIRDAIEAETDRVYFAPWPEMTAAEVAWVRERLGAVVAALS